MKKVDMETPWRKTAVAMYKAPSDSKTYGTFEVEFDKALEYIEKKKREGIRITVTQIVASGVAKALANDVPEINCYIKRGKILPRKDVGIFISVNINKGKEMGGFVIRNMENKTVTDISKEMTERVEKSRQKKDKGAVKNKNVLANIPWPFRRMLFVLIRFITVNLGINLKFLNITQDSFGSVMISNIGSHGLQYGFAALFPAANIPLVVLMGKLEPRAVVRDGEIVIRNILPLAATLDHRIIDGGQGGKLAKFATKYIMNPESLDSI
ncbi:MAG: 2-oxo acid dehydrogenase subunit E2 [Candidatus Marinimicrobia bacterium]|nr:2-oxo acid dehydrogenase subunit E2 [Candidatus Neomarinimicrobiota bacterium]